MDDYEKYYLKRIQTDLRIIWNDPKIEHRTKWQLLDNALNQLTLIKDPSLLKNIQQHFKEQDTVQKELEKYQKEEHHLLDTYAQNMQETYEELQKL